MAGWRREELFHRLEHLLEQAERLFGVGAETTLDERALAYRWQDGALEPIHHPDLYPLDGLVGVERSIARLRTNAASFVRGEPALDALLYGERGTGKSSAVRGLLGELGTKGLRLVEVRPHELGALPRVFAALRGRPERYALFCDDLAFEEGDASFRDLKAVLDGGIEARPENVLILATSNRRHLIRELARDNLEARLDPQGELHPGETVEEKISLSDRFGLLLPFFAFDQETYLRIVDHHARELGLSGSLPQAELHSGALRFALERASRSGRTARQACVLMLQERSAERP